MSAMRRQRRYGCAAILRRGIIAARRRHDGSAAARRGGGGIGDCEKIMGNLLRAFAALLYLRYVPSAAFVRPYRQGASLEETKMSKKEKALKYIHTL